MRKKLYYFLFSLIAAGLFLSCSDPAEEELGEITDIKVSAVEKLLLPANNSSIELTNDLPPVIFGWQKTVASKGGKSVTPNYEVVFFAEDGSPSKPLATVAATTNNISINQEKLNEIAAEAGIEVGSSGIIKWTVRAYYESVSALPKMENRISIRRTGEKIPVTQLFLTGKATEFGEDMAESMRFNKVSDNEYLIFSKLTAGQPFKFVSNNEGDHIRSFFIKDNNKLTEEETNTMVIKTGVYRIRVNFARESVEMSEITDMYLYYAIREQIIPLEYQGRGVWKSTCLINFSKESWGDEKRYKFLMTEVTGGTSVNKFLERLEPGSSAMKEIVITDQRGQMWGDIFGYPDALKNKWTVVTVDMNVNTHSLVAVPADFSAVNTTWQELADRSSSDFVKGFWNTSRKHFNNSIAGAYNQYDYWPEAHALDVVIDAYNRTGDNKYKDVIYQFYEGVRAKNGAGNNWKNNYYDDMAWHGLTHLRALEATNDTRYEESARNLWKWILAGWDYNGTGGIKWRENPASGPGVPSTGPSTIIGARRWVKYGNTETGLPDGLNDLEWTIRMYEWMREYRHVAATGGVYDEVPNIKSAWTYVTGTFLGSAMELYDITKEWHYMEDAIRTADWAIANTSAQAENDFIISDWAEQRDNDVNLFKGIFIRYITRLAMNPDLPTDKRDKYVRFLEYNAKALISYASAIGERDVLIYNYAWYFKPKQSFLRGQTSGCMLIEAVALLEKEGFL